MAFSISAKLSCACKILRARYRARAPDAFDEGADGREVVASREGGNRHAASHVAIATKESRVLEGG